MKQDRDTDRTVHARSDGWNHVREIVRYDRAGKWYFENPLTNYRREVPVDEAVHEAARIARYTNGEVFLGRPGGRTFDARLRRKLKSEGYEIPVTEVDTDRPES